MTNNICPHCNRNILVREQIICSSCQQERDDAIFKMQASLLAGQLDERDADLQDLVESIDRLSSNLRWGFAVSVFLLVLASLSVLIAIALQ